MNKLENKLVFSDGDESNSEDTKISKGLAMVLVQEKGKRPLDQEKTLPVSEKKKVKRVKVLKEPPFQILEHSSPNIMIVKGKVTTTQSIIDDYSKLNDQTKTNDHDKLKSIIACHLISALNKEKKILKVAIIQPSKAKNTLEDKVTEIKFNMNQFSIGDKVDLFKKTSELICSHLISASVAKDRLQKAYKKLENKLKIEVVEKKAMQIKKIELEKKASQITKGNAYDELNKIIFEKEAEIQNLKKKLKLPHDSHVETTKLKVILEEKQNFETELQNAKRMVSTLQSQK